MNAKAKQATSRPKPKRTTPGRPPTGPTGERVSDYPRLTVRIPPATKRQLEALSALRGVAVWQLVDFAALAYFKRLPAAERQLLEQFSARRAAE